MSSDGHGAERRRHQRVPLNLLVQYRFDTFDDFMAEYAADISEGGMFIETDEPRAIGDVVYLQFALRDGTQLIEGLGRVARIVEASGDRPGGMGIEFVDMDVASLGLVQQAVQSLSQDLE